MICAMFTINSFIKCSRLIILATNLLHPPFNMIHLSNCLNYHYIQVGCS